MMLEDYFNEQMAGKAGDIKIEFETGAKIHGTVIAIDKKSVFLDINSKSEGIGVKFFFNVCKGVFAVFFRLSNA